MSDFVILLLFMMNMIIGISIGDNTIEALMRLVLKLVLSQYS